MNNDILDAILEGYDLIRSIGLTPAPPEDERLVRKQRPFAYAFIRFCAVTKTGRLMTGSHAINAPNETIALDQAIQSLRKQSRIGMPKWESLRKQMDISLAEW
jgi:2-dehydropantoate 2-reductase